MRAARRGKLRATFADVGELFRRGSVRQLFIARSLTALGDMFVPVALAFAVLDATGSATGLGTVLATRAVSGLVFLLIGGALADRRGRRLVMVSAMASSSLAQCTAGVLIVTHHAAIWSLCLLVALRGAGSSFFKPASTGAMAYVIEPELRQQALSLANLIAGVSEILGPVLAGLLIVFINPGWLLVGHGAILAISGLLIFRAGFLGRSEMAADQTLWSQVKEGFVFVRGQRWLMTVIASSAVVQFSLLSALNVLGPVVAKRSLGGAPAWAAMVAALGAGSLVGSVLSLHIRLHQPLANAYRFMFIGAGPTLLLLAIPAPLAALVASEFCSGIAIAFFTALELTAMTVAVPEGMISRVDSINRFGSMALMPVGMALAAPLAAAFGLRWTLVAAGAVSLVAITAPLFVDDVRRLEFDSPDASAAAA
jgi:MFS family permease